MSSHDSLVQAFINRLRVRLEQGVDNLNSLASVFVEDAPDRIRKGWDLFQEEVILEADRLEKKNGSQQADRSVDVPAQMPFDSQPQQKVDQLRAKVAELNRKIETRH